MKCLHTIALLVFAIGIFSCQKDWDQSACTDPIAINYEPRAIREDGSCLYNQDEQMIWSNGLRGGWNGNLVEGAFRHEVVVGEAFENLYGGSVDSLAVDSTVADTTINDSLALPPSPAQVSLMLSTGGEYDHLSYFTLINEQNARDFAEGTLRFDCRITEGAAPEYMQLFISGKLVENVEGYEFSRSTYVDISTHSFNDSTFTPVTIHLRNFDKIMMARVNVVCGFQFGGERNIGVELDNIRWSANRDADTMQP
jgi:hypothetical protein